MSTEVNFNYILKSNEDVEISGTVFIPENEDVDDYEFEIEFDRAGQLPSQTFFVNHYGVELTPTKEQNEECDRLKELFTSDYLFLTRICDYAESNIALDLGEVYLVINDCDYREQFDL